MKVRLAVSSDATAVAALYAPYVTGSAISFEAHPPDAADMAARIASGGDLYPWLVAEGSDGALLGYASAGAFRARHAYRFAVETSVYVASEAQGRGVGGALYGRLLPLVEAQGFTQAIAAITLPNETSIRLHERFGFVRAGTYSDVGFKLGQWLSVGLWQRPLAALAADPGEPRPFGPLWREG